MRVGDAGVPGQFLSRAASDINEQVGNFGRTFGFEGLEELGNTGADYWSNMAGAPDSKAEAYAAIAGSFAGIMAPAVLSGVGTAGAIRALGSATGLTAKGGSIGRAIGLLAGTDDAYRGMGFGGRLGARMVSEPVLEAPFNLTQTQDRHGSMIGVSNEYLGTDIEDTPVNRFIADTAISSGFGAAMTMGGAYGRALLNRPYGEQGIRDNARTLRAAAEKATDDKGKYAELIGGAKYQESKLKGTPTALRALAAAPIAGGIGYGMLSDDEKKQDLAKLAGMGAFVSLPGLRGKWRSRLIELVEQMPDHPRSEYQWVQDIEKLAKENGISEQEYGVFYPYDALYWGRKEHPTRSEHEAFGTAAQKDMTKEDVLDAMRYRAARKFDQTEYGVPGHGDVRTLKQYDPEAGVLGRELFKKYKWAQKVLDHEKVSEFKAKLIDLKTSFHTLSAGYRGAPHDPSFRGGHIIPKASGVASFFELESVTNRLLNGPLKGDPWFNKQIQDLRDDIRVSWERDMRLGLDVYYEDDGITRKIPEVDRARAMEQDFHLSLMSSWDLIFEHYRRGGKDLSDLPALRGMGDRVREIDKIYEEHLSLLPEKIRKEIELPYGRTLPWTSGPKDRWFNISKAGSYGLDYAIRQAIQRIPELGTALTDTPKKFTALRDPYVASHGYANPFQAVKFARHQPRQNQPAIPYHDAVGVSAAGIKSTNQERHIATAFGRQMGDQPHPSHGHNPVDFAFMRHVMGHQRPLLVRQGGKRFDLITEIQSDSSKVARDTGYTTSYGYEVPGLKGDYYIADQEGLLQQSSSPYGMTQWHKFALRDAIQRAVLEGKNGIILPSADMVAKMQGHKTVKGWHQEFYEKKFVAETKKILNESMGNKNWHQQMEPIEDHGGFYGNFFEWTEEGAKTVMRNGMRLPVAVGATGLGAAAAASEQEGGEDVTDQVNEAGIGEILAIALGTAFIGPKFARFLKNRGVTGEMVDRIARRGFDQAAAEEKLARETFLRDQTWSAEKKLWEDEKKRIRPKIDEHLDQEPDADGVRPGERPRPEIEDPGPLSFDPRKASDEGTLTPEQILELGEYQAWLRANRQYNARLEIYNRAKAEYDRAIEENWPDLPLMPEEPRLERVDPAGPDQMPHIPLTSAHDPKNTDESLRILREHRIGPEDRMPDPQGFGEWFDMAQRRIIQAVFDKYKSFEQMAEEYGNDEVGRLLSKLRGAEQAGLSKAEDAAHQFKAKMDELGQDYGDVVDIVQVQRALEISDWLSEEGAQLGLFPREVNKIAGLDKEHLLELEAKLLGGRNAEGEWNNQQLFEAAEAMRDLYRDLLTRRRIAGTIGQEEYEALTRAGASYVPFVRLQDQFPWLKNIEPSSAGVVQQTETTLRSMGTMDIKPDDVLPIEDPLTQYMLDAIATERIIIRGQITRQLQEMIDEVPIPGREMFIKGKLALQEVSPDSRVRGNHIELVTTNSKGKLIKRRYAVHDELLYRSLANLGRQHSHGSFLHQTFRGLKQAQRIGVTTPPGFGARNLFRDTLIRNLQASGRELNRNLKYSGGGGIAGGAFGFAYEDEDGNLPPGISTLAGIMLGMGIGYNLPGFVESLDATFALARTEAVRKWTGKEWFDKLGLNAESPEWDGYIKEWAQEGGFGAGWIVRDAIDADRVAKMILAGESGKEITGNVILPDVRGAGRSLGRAWRGGDKVGAMEDVVEAVFPWMSTLGRAMENANRLVEYKGARRAGVAPNEALRRSRDVTLDFRRAGDSTMLRWINETTPFLNARLQGWRKLGRIATNKEGTETNARRYLAATLGVGAPGIGLTLLMQEDPEWHEIPLYERNNFYTFKVPGVDGWLRLPKPHEFAVPSTMSERFLDWMYLRHSGQMRQAEETLSSGLKQMSSQLMGPDSLTPTFLRLPMELVADYDFFRGRPIDPIDESFGAVMPADQADPRTSQFARWMGELVNWKYMSPARIDHVIRSITGNMGSFALDFSTRTLEGEQPGKKNPFLGGFQTNPTSRRQSEANFTTQMKRGERVYNSLRRAREAADFEKASEIFNDNREDLAFYVRYKRLNDGTLRNMRRMRRSLHDPRTSGNLSADERRQLIQQLNERMAQIISFTEGF
jgi:hypothetical protein